MNKKLGLKSGALFLMLTFSLAGCSSGPALISAPDSQAGISGLDDERFARISENISQAITQADAASNPAALDPRIVGPARQQREGAYKEAAASATGPLPALPITDPQAATAGISNTWPRWALSFSKPKEGQPIYAFGFVQGQPHSNYGLWGWVKLFPKVTVPKTALLNVGAKQVTKAQGLSLDPALAARVYAKTLMGQEDGEYPQVISTDNDANLANITAKRQAYAQMMQQTPGIDAKLMVSPAPEGFLALETVDGRALVMASLNYSAIISSPRPLSLPKVHQQFVSGKTEHKGTIVENYKMTALLLIPKAGAKEKVQVLGASESLISVQLS